MTESTGTVLRPQEAADVEIRRLREQVRALQAELAHRSRAVRPEQTTREAGRVAPRARHRPELRDEEERAEPEGADDDAADVIRDLTVAVADDAGRIVRGLAALWAEQVIVAAEAAGAFVEALLIPEAPARRSRSRGDERAYRSRPHDPDRRGRGDRDDLPRDRRPGDRGYSQDTDRTVYRAGR